jgi:hypothetical protein
MLDIWPDLPIFVHAIDGFLMEEIEDCTAALRLNHRVSGIRLEDISDPQWKAFGPLMQHPFPSLTHLWIQPKYLINHAISRTFLGGSAPSLQVLHLAKAPFPALPELLLSTTNIVRLWYNDIPDSGYISPQEMVTSLSALTQLESLSLTFHSPRFFTFPDRAIQIPPPHTRTLLPALTYLGLCGIPEYVEDLVAQLDAPLLESMTIMLYHRKVLEVSELAKFIRRTDKLSLTDRAEVTFMHESMFIILSQELLVGRVDPKTLVLKFPCEKWDSRLSYLAELWESCVPSPSPFECLHMDIPYSWRDVIDDPEPQWLELLHPFSAVKDLRLSKSVASRVAQALRGLPAERVMGVLPALEIVFISGLQPFGPVREAISEFVDARQLSGHPVSIHWEGGPVESEEMGREVDD